MVGSIRPAWVVDPLPGDVSAITRIGDSPSTDALSSGCIVDQRHVLLWPEVKEMTEDRARGTWDEAKGAIKEKAGKISGDRSTEVSGKLDQTKGKLESKIGQAKEAIRHEDDRAR